MLLRAKIAVGLTAGAVAATGAVTAAQLTQTTRTVVEGTAYATVETSPAFTSWFEPSGALVAKGTCGNADDRLLVRTGKLHYRDGAADPKPHEVSLPRPAGTVRLGTDSHLARLKDGRMLFVEMGRATKPFEPAPSWATQSEYWSRSTFELYTSACGDTWQHALTIDTKDVDGGSCAWPQQKDGALWPGGFDRPELHVDPYSGDVFVTTACRGGTAEEFVAWKYRRMLLFRIQPDVSAWALTKAVQLNYGVPVAVTSTADGSVYLLRCDYANRPQLLRLADRGERLVSVSDVQAPGEATAAARCSRANELFASATAMTLRVPVLRLAPAGPRAVRLAYHQLYDGRPQVRYHEAEFGPLPGGEPCAAVRTAYLAQFVVPDEGNVEPVPECGPQPAISKPRFVRGANGASVVHFDLIAPDSTALSSPSAMASGLLYWMEHSPETGLREERYFTISAAGTWSSTRTASTKPWQPKVDPLFRDADYEYGGFLFVDGRCRYALVWNQSHAEPAGYNLFAHWAIVDDLACTGVVAKRAPVPTSAKPSPPASPSAEPAPSASPGKTSAPPSAKPSEIASPVPSAAQQPKFAVTKADLTVQSCTRRQNGTWECPYTAKFTFMPGKGGTFQWQVLGTLRHDCHPAEGSGTRAFKTPLKGVATAGQQSMTAGGSLVFDEPPSPQDVYGGQGTASTAYVQVTDGPRSADREFWSNAVCGKP